MIDMVRLDELLPVATRERAAAIARNERTPQRRRHDTLLGTYTERRPPFIFRNNDKTRIAREALHRLERRVGASSPSMEGCFIDVQDQLVAIACRGGARTRLCGDSFEVRLHDRHQRIGLLA